MESKSIEFQLLEGYHKMSDIPEEEFDWEPIEGYKHGFKKYKSIYLNMKIKNVSSVKNLKLRDSDTFIIGQQKSGTTWLEEIIWLIQNNLDFGRCKQISRFNRVLFIDRGIPEAYAAELESPRVFKTHYMPEYLPDNLENIAKVIYVLRNPKDVAVSTFEFFKKIPEEQFIGTFEDMFNLFITGKIAYGAWWTHVDSYVHNNKVLVLHYEDLVLKPFEEFKRIINFLGKIYSDEQINELIEYTEFKKMKENSDRDIRFLIDQKFVIDGFTFFNKGKIGNWKNYFTQEQSDEMDRIIEENLKYKKQIFYG